MKNEPKKDNRGGKREGAGRLPEYDSELTGLNMMVPKKHKEEIRQKFREILDTYKITKTKKLKIQEEQERHLLKMLKDKYE